MRPSEWCKLHTLIWGSDWCEQHTTLYTNIVFFFFIFEWVKRPPEVVSALNHEVIMWMEKILTMTFNAIIAHGLLKSVRSLTSLTHPGMSEKLLISD